MFTFLNCVKPTKERNPINIVAKKKILSRLPDVSLPSKLKIY
jgi:hypothetical protein